MSELYELPDGWKWQQISDVLSDIKTGTTPPKKEQKYYDNPTINWLSPSDFGEHKELLNSKNKINQIAITDKKAKVYQPNSLLLVAIGATVGKIGIIRNESSSNQQITAMMFKDNIDIDFSYYWFVRMKQKIIDTASAATLPIINQNGIKSLPFPLPPLSEQQRIVSKLDLLFEKIDKSIALHQKNMDEADVFMGSVLNDVFGELEERYEKKQLKEFTNITSSKRIHKADYITSGIPFYRSKEIILKSKDIEPSDILYISENTFLEFEKKFGIPKEDDILITAVGTIGVTYLVNKNDRFYFKDGNLIWLRDISAELNKKYLLYTFKSPQFQNYVDEISKGAAQKALTIIKLNELKIPFPALLLQQKVVKYLDEIAEKTEKVKSVQKEKMDSLKALKASILDSAFRGEL